MDEDGDGRPELLVTVSNEEVDVRVFGDGRLNQHRTYRDHLLIFQEIDADGDRRPESRLTLTREGGVETEIRLRDRDGDGTMDLKRVRTTRDGIEIVDVYLWHGDASSGRFVLSSTQSNSPGNP